METNTETAVKGKQDLSVFDGLQVPVFIVDRDGKIVHGNDAFADLVGRKREQLEGVAITALIRAEESGVERALSGDSTRIETWVTVKNKKYFFELRPTPTYDSKGNVTGAIEAIIDLTGQKLVMQAVHELIGKARAGDLSARANVSAKGDSRILVDGINEMLDDFINPLKIAEDYLDRLSKGDVPEKITKECSGDFNNIKNNLNDLIDEMHILVDEVGVAIRAAREGDLNKRTNPDRTKGVYRKILRGFNDALDALISPLKVAEDYVDRLGKGDIPDKITADYQGDFNIIKNNLNNCIDEMNGITGEMVPLLQTVADGDLARRGNPDRFHGAYKNMILGMNRLVDSIATPLADLTGCLDRMAVNDLTKKMSKDYPGVWNELKNAFNGVNDTMVRIRETIIRVSDGDLSDLDHYEKIDRRSENDNLIPAFKKLMESIRHVINEVIGMTRAMTAGDLSARADENKFQGAYRDIVHSLDALVDSVTAPVNELTGVLECMAVNDYTRKIANNYSGVWAKLKQAIDLTLERILHIEETTIKISRGDLSDLEAYRKIGKRSEKDQLVPAFTRMMEAIEGLIEDTAMLAEESVNGKLSTRADITKHQGQYRKVAEGVNATLDAILQPINEASACLQEMANGNLDVAVKGDYKGDHAVIKENLNATLDALNDILGQVAIAADQVATGARQVSDSSQSLSQASTESASSLEEIAASMHEITSQVSMNAENATQANQLAAQAKVSAEKGNAEMGAMVKAMNDINESASSISKIIKAIDEIAFQTNLLALNAAVEAARAGKHGKGFTVVAEEVRNLAQRSATAAKETAEMIEGSIKRTEAGAKIAEDTSRALEEIVAGSTKVTDLIGEIASASKEQAEGIGQINQGLSQVDQVTQQVTASSEESASASEELSSQSLQLKQMLDKFSLRKRGFSMADSGLPDGVTPEMLQMLRRMMQSQKSESAAGHDMPFKYPGSKQSKKSGAVKPSDIIALDDTDFGRF